jgi:hypothetical protein
MLKIRFEFRPSKSKMTLLGWATFFLVGTLGCRPGIPDGNYQGMLSSSLRAPQAVSIRLKYEQPYLGVIEVRDLHQNLIDTLMLKWSKKSNHIRLSISTLGSAPVTLYPVKTLKGSEKNLTCYQGVLQFRASLCFREDQFILHASGSSLRKGTWTLSGSLSAIQEPVLLEDPADYTLKEALDRALSRGFDARIEFQRVLQASEAARVAYFNLLPHVDYKSVFAISTLLPNSIAGFVANFVPFVIPTRWLKVKEAKDLKKAEEMTLDILRADLTYQVETLGYVYERDRSNHSYYEMMNARVEGLLAHISDIGQQDFGKIGNMIDELGARSLALNNFILQEKIRLRNSLGLDLTALSLSMGFKNSKAVRSFDIEEDESLIQTAAFMDPSQQEDIVRAAVARSLELKQIDYLIDNSQRVKEEYYFNWADPDVPSSMSVSLSLVPYLARAKAVIQELLVRREQMQAQIVQKATNAVMNYNAALESYQVTKPEYDRLNQRLDLVSADILDGKLPSDIHANGPGAQWLLNTHFQFKLKLNDSIAMFRMARAQMQRVLLESYYARMLQSSDLEDEPKTKSVPKTQSVLVTEI